MAQYLPTGIKWESYLSEAMGVSAEKAAEAMVATIEALQEAREREQAKDFAFKKGISKRKEG